MSWFLLEAPGENLFPPALSKLLEAASDPWRSLACRHIAPISVSTSSLCLYVFDQIFLLL